MQSSPYILPLVVTAILLVPLALLLWRRRGAPGVGPLAVLMLGVALWSLAYAFSLAQVVLSAQLFWVNMCYLGIGLVPASWLAFALEYVGLGAWLTRRRLALLAIEPLLALALALTNDLHLLFRTQVRLLDVGTYLVLESVLGPAFWLHTMYSYLLTGIGTFLLLRNFVRMPRVYRRQASTLLVAVCAPWAGNIVYLSGLNPFPYLDFTPFAFSISAVALAWDLLHFHLFEIVPIARSTVLENMEDGTWGLYSKLRHPVYVFGSLGWLGALLVLLGWSALIIWLVVVVIEFGRARREERVLAEAFGSEYEAYRSRTWF